MLTLDDLIRLCDTSGNAKMKLTVDVTPDGHGDCVRTVRADNDEKARRFFVKPEERTMSIKDFRKNLRSGRKHFYANRSQSKDTREAKSLKCDADGLKVFVYARIPML